jgi:hypothetical protein
MEQDQKAVQLPAPTAWPIVLALGVTLLFAGLLTSADITVVGGVLMVAAAVGWFRDVLPRELQEAVPVDPVAAQAVTARTEVTRPAPEIHRLRIPRWRCWPAPTAFCRTAASGIRSIFWRRW